MNISIDVISTLAFQQFVYLARIFSHEGISPFARIFYLIILLDCDNSELIVSHESIKDTSLKCSNNHLQCRSVEVIRSIIFSFRRQC